MPRVAIQTLLYKSSDHLATMLRSLQAQTFKDFDVWCCENSMDAAEADRAEAIVRASGLPFHFIRSATNSGFAGGHQMLFQAHDAPFVLLLNDDATLEPTYVQAVMERMESDPMIGSVTGVAYRSPAEPRVIDTAGLEYRCLGSIVDRFAGTAHSVTEAEKVFGVSGAVGLYRRSAVEKTGGLFDPTWFMYKEDVDLALRLRQAGFQAWIEPNAVAYHERGIKEEGNGILTRIRMERKRPAVLRESTYVNQWRVYRRHWRTVGFRDKLQTAVTECFRSVLVFVTSPRIFFRAWRRIIAA